MSRIHPLTFDPSGSFIPDHGISAKQLEAFGPRMVDVRDEVFNVDLQLFSRVRRSIG